MICYHQTRFNLIKLYNYMFQLQGVLSLYKILVQTVNIFVKTLMDLLTLNKLL